MKLRELAEFVNQLAKQHQELVERVNLLEKQRVSFGLEDEDAVMKLKRATDDLGLMITNDITEQVKKEQSQYKYPYDERAKLLQAVILLLEIYQEEQPPQWVPRS